MGPSRPAPSPGERPAPAVPPPTSGPAPSRASGGSLLGGITAPTSADWNTLFARLQRLARLDTSIFGEIYADAGSTIPVAAFAALVLVISGIGGMLFISETFTFDFYKHGAGEFFLLSAVVGTVFALASLAAWSGASSLLLRQFSGAQPDLVGLSRVFAVSLIPLVLALFLFWTDAIIGLTAIAFGAVASLAVIGVLESVDVKPGHAWLASLTGFAAFVIILAFLGHGTWDLAPGFFSVL